MAVFLSAACAVLPFESVWKDGAVDIDGKDTEWQSALMTGGNISFGIRNDSEYLYLCVTATDKKTKAQLMGLFRQNFYIWFDPAGKQARGFGLQFINESPLMDEAFVGKIRYIRTEAFQLVAQEMMKNLEVSVLENGSPAAQLSDAAGIEVAAGVSMNGRKLTYEFKVPLSSGTQHPFAVGARPGSLLGIGIETSPVDVFALRKKMQAGTAAMASDDVARMPGMAGGGMNEAARRPGAQRFDSDGDYEIYRELESMRNVQFWSTVRLARDPGKGAYDQ